MLLWVRCCNEPITCFLKPHEYRAESIEIYFPRKFIRLEPTTWPFAPQLQQQCPSEAEAIREVVVGLVVVIEEEDRLEEEAEVISTPPRTRFSLRRNEG